MLVFIVRRIAQSLFVMFVVAMLAFIMFNYVGDPVHQMVGIETSFEERAQLRESLGLNDPSLVQFARFAGNALKGERKGARSSYLTKKWRVLYVVEGDRFEVLVLEVNPHDY